MRGGSYANDGDDAISSSLGGVENGNALVIAEFLCSRRHHDGNIERIYGDNVCKELSYN